MVNTQFQEIIDTAKYFCSRLQFSKGRDTDNTPTIRSVNDLCVSVKKSDFKYTECVKCSNGNYRVHSYTVFFDDEKQTASINLSLDEEIRLTTDESELFLQECKQHTYNAQNELEGILYTILIESDTITDSDGKKYVKMSSGKSTEFSFDFYSGNCGCAYVSLPSDKLDVVFLHEDKKIEPEKQAIILSKFELMSKHLLGTIEDKFK